MRRTLLTALLCGLVVCGSAFAGSIRGKITYDGKVPNLRPHDMSAAPECAAKHPGGKAPNQALVLGDGNALANIFVQVKNAPAGSHQAPSRAVVIDQDGCIYRPHVTGVMVGQPVEFTSSDGIKHNVHGTFEIGNLPDGAYEVEAWHEKLGTQAGRVEVQGGAARLDFTFTSPR